MPDLESFIISAKNQEDLKSGIQRKKKKKPDDDQITEDLDTDMPLIKSSGTRSRPVNGTSNVCKMSSNEESKGDSSHHI